jgi:predicted secreted protein
VISRAFFVLQAPGIPDSEKLQTKVAGLADGQVLRRRSTAGVHALRCRTIFSAEMQKSLIFAVLKAD